MLVYAAILMTCLGLLTVAHTGSKHQQKVICLICIASLTCFSALRGYVGTDTYAYHLMFIESRGEEFLDSLRTIEPLFALLMKSFALFSDNSFGFVASISILQGLLVARLASTSRNPLDFLMVYTALFYLSFHFNIIRAGTAILILISANRVIRGDKEQGKFYLLGIAAILMHYSTIVGFLPMLIARQRSTTQRFLTIALVTISLAFAYRLIVADEMIVGKYFVYFELLTPDVSNSASMTFIFGLPLYLMLYISVVSRKNRIGLTLFFMVWLFARWLTSIFTLAGRIELIVNSILLFTIIEISLNGWRHQIRKISLTGLTVMWLFASLSGLANEDAIRDQMGVTGEAYLNSSFTPYRFFWDEK